MCEINPNIQKHLLERLQAMSKGLNKGRTRLNRYRNYLSDETIRELLLLLRRRDAVELWAMSLLRTRIFEASTREDVS